MIKQKFDTGITEVVMESLLKITALEKKVKLLEMSTKKTINVPADIGFYV